MLCIMREGGEMSVICDMRTSVVQIEEATIDAKPTAKQADTRVSAASKPISSAASPARKFSVVYFVVALLFVMIGSAFAQGSVSNGTAGQLGYYAATGNNISGFTMSGDCTVSAPSITCTTSSGAPIVTSTILNSALPTATTSQLYGGSGTTGAANVLSLGETLRTSGGSVYTQLGIAMMFPRSNQTTNDTDPYNAIDPWGNPVDCSGTHSQCLQEFLNAMSAGGWKNILISCAKGSQFSAGIIESTVTVNVPAMQDQTVIFRACNLNFNVTTVPGLVLDSQGNSTFIFDGKIVYNVTSPNGDTTTNPSCAVLIHPTTNTGDGFKGVYAGYLQINAPVVSVQTSGAIATAATCMDVDQGSINSTINLQELNPGQTAYYALFVYGASTTTGLMASNIYISNPHGYVKRGVQVGASATNQLNYRYNVWSLNNVNGFGAGNVAVDTYGNSDVFNIGEMSSPEGGSMTYGMVVESGGSNNQFKYGAAVSPTTAAFLDGGTGDSFVGPSSTVGYASGAQYFAPQFVGTSPNLGKAAPFVAQSNGQTGYSWADLAGGGDSKWWDCVTQSVTVFACRTINDAQSAANAWLQVTRSGIAISSVQIGDGTHFLTLPIASTDTAVARNTLDTLLNKTTVDLALQASSAGDVFSTPAGLTGPGTIGVTAAGSTVAGSSTFFTKTFQVGQTITANGESHTVEAVASDTSMTTDAWTNTAAGVSYTASGGTMWTVLPSGRLIRGAFASGASQAFFDLEPVLSLPTLAGNLPSITVAPSVSLTGAATSNSLRGANFNPTIGGSNNQNWTGALALQGISVAPNVSAGATGTLTGSASIIAGAFANSGSMTVTGVVGLVVAKQTAGTNNSEIVIGQNSIPTGNFAIFDSSGYPSEFGSGHWAANGAVAKSLTSLGPTGSHTTVQEWFTVYDSSGVQRWIPAF